MLRRTVSAAAFAALLTLPASAQTVDEISNKVCQAMGGKEKLQSVQTLRMTGKLMMGQGMEAPFTMEVKRPASVRNEFVFQGMTGIQAFDGKQGWMIMPFMGKTDPEPLPEEALKQIREQADWEGPLVDYKAKGHTVEMLGKESVEGAEAYKLKVTLKNGDVQTVFVEAESFLPIKVEAKVKMQGQEIEGESVMGDYKDVGGIKFPFSIESRAKGAPEGQQIVFEKIDVNPVLDDARFKMPEVKKPAAPAAEPKKSEEKKP